MLLLKELFCVTWLSFLATAVLTRSSNSSRHMRSITAPFFNAISMFEEFALFTTEFFLE